MFVKLRYRLAASGQILVMLLVVTLLSDLVSDRLGFTALLAAATGVRVDVGGILTWVQRVVILMAFLVGLLGRRGDMWRLSAVAIGVVSVGLVISLAALIATMPGQPAAEAAVLLRDGFMLWIMNVLTFAAWYWLIDTQQDGNADATGGRRDLLFPQQASDLPAWATWRPRPLDYLFVAFNTSTAFSPTDTIFLTERAKLLMICQAFSSLLIVAVILARAINVIQ